jgi:hypothetical protein
MFLRGEEVLWGFVHPTKEARQLIQQAARSFEEWTMTMRNGFAVSVLAVSLALAGCKSAQDKANDAAITQAKQQAAATGQAQQVVWTDKDGKTTTVLVQPPAPGQAQQQVTTTVATAQQSGGTVTQSTKTSTSMEPVVSAVPANTPAMAPVGSSPAMAPGDASQPAMVSSGGVAPAGPVAGGGPVVSPVTVEIARGTNLAIRMNQTISVKTARAGDHFSGELARPVVRNGSEVIPAGTPVEGRIDEAHRRGHFKGASTLELRLTSLRMGGKDYRLDTRENFRSKKGKGKRTAALIGGGAGLGMLVGGLATGGVGLVVGGLAGGGLGTAVSGLTGNRDLAIPAETVVDFKLADDLVVAPM